jgi:Xaa-Pro dipeptidase
MLHELTAPYRHYHAALTLTIVTGEADARHQDMFATCRAALEAYEATLRPERAVGDLFEAHRRAYVEAGHGEHFLNVCGYSMGAVWPPTWMEDPLIRARDPQVLAPGMVFFMHMLTVDRERGLMMSLGETAIVTTGSASRSRMRHAG